MRPLQSVIFSSPSFLPSFSLHSLSHSLTLSCSRCSCYLCVQDLSHSLSLGWFEILLGVSTIFVFRISLCVHDLSSASLLYILVVFSVLSGIFLVVVPSSGYKDQRREILTSTKKVRFRVEVLRRPELPLHEVKRPICQCRGAI